MKKTHLDWIFSSPARCKVDGLLKRSVYFHVHYFLSVLSLDHADCSVITYSVRLHVQIVHSQRFGCI